MNYKGIFLSSMQSLCTKPKVHVKVNIHWNVIRLIFVIHQFPITLKANTIIFTYLWHKVFSNGPSQICGRQPLKNLKGYGLLEHIIFIR